MNGVSPQSWPGGVELVGRRADRDVARQQILPAPGVGAGDVEADRQVVDDGDRLRGARQLGVELPLQPAVEGDARDVRLAKDGDAVTVGALQRRRPVAPVLAVQLGERAVGGEVGQRLALPAAEPVEPVLAVEVGEDRLQRLHLQLEDRVAIDLAGGVQRAPGVAEALPRPRVQPLPPGHLLDAQEERVGEPAARRVVGGGLDRRHRRRRHHRVHHHHAAAEAPGEAPDARQIGQIADPPARPRARGVDLRGEAPGAQIVGQEAVSGADDQRDVPPSPCPSGWRRW